MTLQSPLHPQDHLQGSMDAPIVVIQYGDFQCPYSAAAVPAIKAAQERFGDQLVYAFRHFPLPDVHPDALLAAQAAEAAAVQGKFWEMYELLFANQEAIDEANLPLFASHLRLDKEKFERELREKTHEGAVKRSQQDGLKNGAHGTPTFFINGRFYDNHRGLWETEALLEAIENATK